MLHAHIAVGPVTVRIGAGVVPSTSIRAEPLAEPESLLIEPLVLMLAILESLCVSTDGVNASTALAAVSHQGLASKGLIDDCVMFWVQPRGSLASSGPLHGFAFYVRIFAQDATAMGNQAFLGEYQQRCSATLIGDSEFIRGSTLLVPGSGIHDLQGCRTCRGCFEPAYVCARSTNHAGLRVDRLGTLARPAQPVRHIWPSILHV